MACKDGDKEQIVYETADLWFHCLIMLARHNISPEAVLSELERREGISGIEENDHALKTNLNQSEVNDMEDCIFCKIVRGEIPATKIYEDNDIIAFHDIHPATPVHFLLVPKQHIVSLNEVEPDHHPLLGKCCGVLPGKGTGVYRWISYHNQYRARRWAGGISSSHSCSWGKDRLPAMIHHS